MKMYGDRSETLAPGSENAEMAIEARGNMEEEESMRKLAVEGRFPG